MTHGAPGDSAHAGANYGAVQPFWSTFTIDDLVRVQQAQWGAFNTWQQSFLAFNNDLWEQWASHFGGGVPIDG
jgi:hypothetical protein